MNRIEFIEGELYCRFDGVMVEPEVYMEIFGFDGELDMLDEDTYLVNGIVYTDKKLGDLIKLFGEVHGEVEEYDEIFTEGRGFVAHYMEERLNNTVVIPLRHIEYLESIKPFNEFANDYPNANIKKYIEFMDCLDEYYNNLHASYVWDNTKEGYNFWNEHGDKSKGLRSNELEIIEV